MIDLLQLLKELRVPASDTRLFIIPYNEKPNCLSGHQLELDLESHSKETV